VGHVLESPLLNYNTTVAGNFGSSVWDWSIGPGTVVPSTGDVWLSDNLTQAYRGAPPLNAPAVVYDPTTNSFVGIVSQLPDTSDLLFDAANGLIYSTDPLNNTVGVFNPTDNSWLSTIPVGTDPSALALDASNNTLYVTNSGSGNLTLINTSTELVESASIALGQYPVSEAFDATHSQLFVACSGSAVLYVINTVTNRRASTIPLVGDAGGVAVSEAAGTVAVTVPSMGHLTVAYTSNFAVITGTLSVGLDSHVVVTSPDGNEFVVADSSHAHLVTVNASAATIANASIPVGAAPAALTPDGSTGLVYSWSPTYRNLTPVHPGSGRTDLPSPTLGARPDATAYDPFTNRVFVADSLTHALLVLNSTTFAPVLSPIALPARPYALADNPATSTIYIGLNGSIVALDAATGQLTGPNASLSNSNGALLVDSADGLLWDMNNVSGLVAYHLASLSPAITTTVGPDTSGPGSLALDPTTDQLFAITGGGPGLEVAVVDASSGSTVSGGIVAGLNLTSLAFDPSDGQVYALGANLTMIDASTLVVASETIYLPAHMVLGGSLVYEPSRQFLYATTSVGPGSVGEVTLIDGSSEAASYTASGTLYLGYAPTALLAVDLPGATGVGSGIVVAGNLNSGTLGIIATSPAEIDFLTASPDAIDLGQSTQILVQYIGGAGIVDVSYSGLPNGCLSQDTDVLTCTPSISGNFTIVVKVTDELGGVDRASTFLTVAAGLGVSATFSAPTFPQLDPGYSFGATGNATGGTPGYNYTWTFGDGTSVQGEQVTHSYVLAGNYALTLTVRDALGEIGTSAWSVQVNSAPTLTVTYSSDVVDVNRSITFDSSTAGGTGSGVTNWTFGDGTSGSGTSIVHSWTQPGTYEVDVTHDDGLGTPATSSVSVLVNPALTGSFTATPPAGTLPAAGKQLQFSATAGGGTSPDTVVWSFGDGSMATGDQVSHAYALAGNYSVNVTVTDRTGATLNGTLSVSVSPVTGQTSTSSSTLTFPLGLFLGVLAGAALAAVVVYAVGPRRHKEHPPPPPPPSPYVAPETAEWRED
jgi:YVTN family beta-propeller protein